MFSTVRSRLYSLVALALLPAIAVIAYDEIQLRQRISDKIHEDAVRVVTLAGRQLETLIGETHTRFELLDDIPEIRAMNADTSRRLAEVLKNEPIYTNLGVADPSGRVVCSAIPFTGEVRVDDRPFFKRAVETRDFAVGTYQVNPISGEPGLNLGYPILESDGTLRGVLFASLGLEWANQFVRRAQLPEGASLLVVDAGGTILARSVEPEKWVGKNVAQTELGQRMLRSESAEALVAAGVDGIERLHAYTPIRSAGLGTNAYAALGIPTAVAAAEANRSLLRNLGILALGAIACFVLAGFMAELLFLRETRAVLDAARGLEAGNLGSRTGLPPGRGELKEVARALDNGIAALQTAQKDLVAAREAADAANRAKSSFLAVMSHEIRTPMNAILNMTSLALETEMTPKQRQYLSVAHSSARNLLGIINDILDFSKIEAEKLELEEAPFSLRTVLEEVTETFRARVIEKHVELIAHVATDVPDGLVGDALRLRQIITNLVGNAFKFTEKGEISVKVSREGNAEPGPGGLDLRITVRDSGVGIPKEQQGRLFQAFTQADASTSRKYGGTGLGLAISRRLARMMGGELAFESEAGKGTTFFFTARFGLQERSEAAAAVVPEGIRERHALVVEDSPSSREVLETFLENWRIPSVSVESAEEGLALLERRNRKGSPDPIGLVILDWMLPGMDGLAAAERIRQRSETRGLPIVMISAYAGSEEEARSAEIGVNVFLPKPLTASSLFNAIVEAEGIGVPVARRDRPASIHREFEGTRVLVAEDNEANRMVAMELLSRLGIDIDIAENGREAVDRTRENRGRYAAILMDMQMPEMDGLEATRELRADPAFQDLPILAMTANAMKEDLEACLSAGMNDYVTKPIDRGLLAEALRRWLPKSARVGSSPAREEPAGAIPVLPGIDVEGALRRLGLPWESLRAMLLRFGDGERRTLELLRTAAAASDTPAVARHAHSLAGAAGNLGADLLREAAKELEKAAREETPGLKSLLPRIEERAAVVFSSIDSLQVSEKAASPAPTERPVDSERLRLALERLHAALEDSDPASSSAVLDELTGMGAGEDLERLRTLAEGYQYDEAAAIVARLLEEMENA